MMSAKVATPDLLKIKVFWSKGYNVIISGMRSPMKFYDVTQIISKTWYGDQILVTLAFVWEKLS